MSARAKLLHNAARCYLSASMRNDACRCFELSGDALQAAKIHEEEKRWEKAAPLYRAAHAWREAARCFQRCGMPLDAGQCFLNAKDLTMSAWSFADGARLYDRARSLLRRMNPDQPTGRVMHDIILSRCEAGNGSRARAVKLLRATISRFPQLDTAPSRVQAEEWTMVVARHLRRPDLTAAIHAAAHAAGFPDAARRWEAWAMEALGDAAGVPETESEDQDGQDENG